MTTCNASWHTIIGRTGRLAAILGIGAAAALGFGAGSACASPVDSPSESPATSSTDSNAPKPSSTTDTKTPKKPGPDVSASTSPSPEEAGVATTATRSSRSATTKRPRRAAFGKVPTSAAPVTPAAVAPGATRVPNDESGSYTSPKAADEVAVAAPKAADEVVVAAPKAADEVVVAAPSAGTVITAVAQPPKPPTPTNPSGSPVQPAAMLTMLGAVPIARAGRPSSTATTVVTASTVPATTPAVGPAPVKVLTPQQYADRFTGHPSFLDGVAIFAARVVKAALGVFGVQLSPAGIGAALASTSPPAYLTFGLQVAKTEFDGTPVYTISTANPSGDYVVGIHGGAFTVQPTVLHWLAYTSIVRDTGATVVVPIYALANAQGSGGSAGTVVPEMADLISSLVHEHGARAVSVYGDSAGGNIALAAVQELVRRGSPTPGHMVLLSPVLDLTMSNPNIKLVDDPVLRADPAISTMWAGGLDLTDPLVSPLYGALTGLPPTTIYSGSAEILAPDVLRLQDTAQREAAPLYFVLRGGQIHDWALPLLPDGQAVKSGIYRQLGLRP